MIVVDASIVNVALPAIVVLPSGQRAPAREPAEATVSG
jgi:hypothetical protein